MIPSIWLFSGDRENVRYCLGEAKKKNIRVAHNMTNHTESWKISQCLII